MTANKCFCYKDSEYGLFVNLLFLFQLTYSTWKYYLITFVNNSCLTALYSTAQNPTACVLVLLSEAWLSECPNVWIPIAGKQSTSWMCVRVCVCVHERMHVRACMHACVCVCMCVCVSFTQFLSVYMKVSVIVYMFLSSFSVFHTHIPTHSHIHECPHTYM